VSFEITRNDTAMSA